MLRGWLIFFDHEVIDPAIIAEGNDLLLLSEDKGYRVWAETTFNISTTWLQPVLILAVNEGHLTMAEYCEAINLLALSGHSYISLDSNCLLHQAQKDDFYLTIELSQLLKILGGESADLRSNSAVSSKFIDMLWYECPSYSKIQKIVNEVFSALTCNRQEDLREIIILVLNQINQKKRMVTEYALSWLIGHSFGMVYFNDLLRKKKHLEALKLISQN